MTQLVSRMNAAMDIALDAIRLQDNEIQRLKNVVEAQRQALLFWRREFDKEYGRQKFIDVVKGV